MTEPLLESRTGEGAFLAGQQGTHFIEVVVGIGRVAYALDPDRVVTAGREQSRHLDSGLLRR